jgi:hypothetical protein
VHALLARRARPTACRSTAAAFTVEQLEHHLEETMKKLITTTTASMSIDRRHFGKLMIAAGCAGIQLPFATRALAAGFLLPLFLRLVAGNVAKSIVRGAIARVATRRGLLTAGAVLFGAVADAAIDTAVAAAAEPHDSTPPPPPDPPRIDAVWSPRRNIDQNCFALEIANHSGRPIVVEPLRVGLIDVHSGSLDDECVLGVIEVREGCRTTFAFGWPNAPAAGLKRIVSRSHTSCQPSGLILVEDQHDSR